VKIFGREIGYSGMTRLLIVLLFAVRLINITDPPVEISHNWRQTTSLMVARNFYQTDNNILYPTLDETGEKRGVVGMEFPALPYSIYLVSTIFGYDHWYGRLINLILVSFGMWYFFRLLTLWFTERLAFFSTVAMAFSALFHLSRKVLPDPAALSLVIIGLWYGSQFLRSGGWLNAFLYVIFAALGVLVKIPFGAYLIMLAFPFFDQQVTGLRRTLFVFASVAIVSTVYWWYFIWNMGLAEKFGLWYNSGRSVGDGYRELLENLPDVFERFYFSAFHSYLFFLLTISGLILAIIKKEKRILFVLAAGVPVFAGYMLKSGFLFAHHGYYALVIVPVMALLTGYFITTIQAKIAIPLLVIAAIESVANQQHDFFIRDKEFVKTSLTNIANKVSGSTDLVALVTNQNPNEFYFLNRKGWMVVPEMANPAALDSLADKGCKLLFMKKGKYDENLPYTRVFENQDYLVFDLNQRHAN
jgi:hypothetical protein